MNTTASSVDRSALRWWVLWIVLSVIGLAVGMVSLVSGGLVAAFATGLGVSSSGIRQNVHRL